MDKYEIDVLKRTINVLNGWLDSMTVKDCPCTTESHELISRISRIVNENEKIIIENDWVKNSEYKIINKTNKRIFSVLRVIDGIVFNVNDKVQFGTIKSFKKDKFEGFDVIKVIINGDDNNEYFLHAITLG